MDLERISRVRVSGGPPLPPETARAGGSRTEPKSPARAATSARQAQPPRSRVAAGRTLWTECLRTNLEGLLPLEGWP